MGSVAAELSPQILSSLERVWIGAYKVKSLRQLYNPSFRSTQRPPSPEFYVAFSRNKVDWQKWVSLESSHAKLDSGMVQCKRRVVCACDEQQSFESER